MSAYPEYYLNRAMTSCGEMFDFAINDLGIEPELFIDVFCTSAVCRRMQNGEPTFLVGMSGPELVMECLREKNCDFPRIVDDGGMDYSRTPEFWGGWAVCFYQWISERSYAEIFDVIKWDRLMHMYITLHEADITKFAETADNIIRKKRSETRLKKTRTAFGCSQNDLSGLSGVSLRSIQMYEQRNKDINKAQAETLFKLAKALGCHIEDLLEPRIVAFE